MNLKVPRIAGVDLAYAISSSIVIAFCLSVGLTNGVSALSGVTYNPWVDTFIGLFFFLQGTTSTLMLTSKMTRTKKINNYLYRKGIAFLLAGLFITTFWPVNFMSSLGLMFMLSPLLMQLNTAILRFLIIISFTITVLVVAFSETQEVSGILYSTHISEVPSNIFNALFISGYDRFLPWFVFYLAGLIYSRNDFMKSKVRRSNTLLALIAVAMGGAVQVLGGTIFTSPTLDDPRLIFPFISHPEFSVVAFVIGGIGLCVLILNFCLWVMEKLKRKMWLLILQKLGTMKHTYYISHIVFGGILITIFQPQGFMHRWTIAVLTISYLLSSLLFVWLWKKQFSLGPVEWFLYRLAGIDGNK